MGPGSVREDPQTYPTRGCHAPGKCRQLTGTGKPYVPRIFECLARKPYAHKDFGKQKPYVHAAGKPYVPEARRKPYVPKYMVRWDLPNNYFVGKIV